MEFFKIIKNNIVMKKIILFAFLVFGMLQLNAQQDPQYTQFMFNKLAFNPGYAGSSKGACFTALHRSQWLGLEGAPTTQVFSVHTPLSGKRVGLGLAIVHDNIGPTDSWSASLSYAYRIPIESGTLGLGLQGTLRRYEVDFINERLTHPNDNLVQATETSNIISNVGFGLYYEQDNFYFGVSVPHLIRNDISLLTSNFATNNVQSVEEIHAYLMAGIVIPIAEQVKLKPAGLVKYSDKAPVDFDLNFSLLFMDKFLVGATYRFGGSSLQGNGESIDLVAQFIANGNIRIGAAFDFTLSELSNYSNGSFEIMAQYCLGDYSEKVANPRFF